MNKLSRNVGFVSLGCAKALVDSERILTQLKTEGYGLVDSYDGADVVVVNTCGFVDSAVEESLDAIGEALDHNGKVIVTGCLGEREGVIRERYPNVLNISGAHQYEAVMEAVHDACPPDPHHDPLTALVPPQGIKLTPRHYAYLKISEGCNHRCTFCIIPSLRGDLVSRPITEVMSEAEGLVNNGVKELLVVSQDTSAYGVDLKYPLGIHNGRPMRTKFIDLCRELGGLGAWVRLHYVYPYPHVDEAIELMANGLILPYLDIPMQHASRAVLKAMKRPANSENMLRRIENWRSVCPEMAIRSTFIVGFPGETERDFEELLSFLDEANIDRAGCFEYSAVDGAKANALADPVPDEVKAERHQRFVEKQAEISQRRLQEKVGQEVAVIIDEVNGDQLIGRTIWDSPEVDGVIHLTTDQPLSPGDTAVAEITGCDEHDLEGEIAYI